MHVIFVMVIIGGFRCCGQMSPEKSFSVDLDVPHSKKYFSLRYFIARVSAERERKVEVKMRQKRKKENKKIQVRSGLNI